MFQKKREYRKNFRSSGQLYMAGETLEFISHDVSVKGVSIEVIPGKLLAEFADFETYAKENTTAEIFVKDLMLTGEVELIWLRQVDGKIMMGFEFHDVMYNADRIWLKRQFYRKECLFTGYLVLKNGRIEFEGKNVSVDGLMIHIDKLHETLHQNSVVKLYCESLKIKALAKVCWIKEDVDDKGCFLGLRYLAGE